MGGVFNSDTVKIGDVEVPETLFAEISTVSFGPLNIAFAMGKFDGILGLGFSKISEYGIPTAFEMMVKNKLIDEPVFSFYLQKDASQQGQLTFGGVDHSKFDGEIEYVPLTDESYWKVSLEGMKYATMTSRRAFRRSSILARRCLLARRTRFRDRRGGWRDACRGQGVHD